MSDIDEAGALAEKLRALASDLEAGTQSHRLWAGLKAHNRHCERIAAPLIYDAFGSHWPGESTLPVAMIASPKHGTVNWGAVRTLLSINSLDWPREYDRHDAPPKRLIQIRAIKPSEWNQVMGYEELAEPGDFQEDVWRRVEEDRTADELQQWHTEQAMAWASTLMTVTARISRKAHSRKEPTLVAWEQGDELVTLRQITPYITVTKRTLERYKTTDPKFPTPDVIGGNGSADHWKWSTIKAYLEDKGVCKRPLPDVHPSAGEK